MDTDGDFKPDCDGTCAEDAKKTELGGLAATALWTRMVCQNAMMAAQKTARQEQLLVCVAVTRTISTCEKDGLADSINECPEDMTETDTGFLQLWHQRHRHRQGQGCRLQGWPLDRHAENSSRCLWL